LNPVFVDLSGGLANGLCVVDFQSVDIVAIRAMVLVPLSPLTRNAKQSKSL
jgi:hypothetical protein